MKFVCMKCDEQMKLIRSIPPDGNAGSMSVMFSCPRCFYQFCMVTNASETQIVASLGVKIGRQEGGGAEKSSRCPFSDVVQEIDSRDSESEIPWTEEASGRLMNIPEFIRPMARQGIEQFAQSRGYRQIDEKVLDEARDRFGM